MTDEHACKCQEPSAEDFERLDWSTFEGPELNTDWRPDLQELIYTALNYLNHDGDADEDAAEQIIERLLLALREAAERRKGVDTADTPEPDAGRDAAIEAACEAAFNYEVPEPEKRWQDQSESDKQFYRGGIRAAITAYEAHRGSGAVGGWQPIETAPKDGTHFLAYENGRHYDCWAHFDTREGWYWMDHADSEPAPTHWMPLPQPPAIEVKP